MRLPWQMSDLHPHALSLTDDAIGSDFALALEADLAEMTPPEIIQRYRCSFAQGVQTDALVDAGFHASRLTRIVDLPLSLVDHPMLNVDLPDGISTHWFRRKERAPWNQWLTAHWRHYQAVHLSNPPREPVGGLNKVFIGDDLVEGLALRLGPQGRVRSFASLRKESQIGWIGGAQELLAQTLATCLRRATAIGWIKATIEVDDDDVALWGLIEALGVAPDQTYVTWQLERDPAKRPN